VTLRMLDSIVVGNLPPGASAYLGYVDGRWPTFDTLAKTFPRAQLLSIAVFADGVADGCDCEAGDLTAAQVPGWVQAALKRGVHRPVVYASASAMPGVLAGMEAAGIARASVRLLSAHYGAGEHICGPATCAVRDGSGRVVPACDGTQWRDNAPGEHDTLIDESVLSADFFAAPPPAPRKPAAARRIDMIMIQPDPAQVPAGTAWPGVFLLGDAGLRHVTSPPDLKAYQQAGIPGPVTISWQEYLARKGQPARKG
jgi:hypothetical protein